MQARAKTDMRTHRKPASRSLTAFLTPLALSFFATLLALPASAANIDGIYDIPLQTRVSVPPNVMFILDDSGSMQSEILPDELSYNVTRLTDGNGDGSGGYNRTGIGFVYPRVEYPYKGSGTQYDNYVADPDDIYGKIVRSSHFNKQYYDPTVVYLPWLKADGSSYPNASTSCSLHNPENTGAGCRSLFADATNENNNRWQRYGVASCTSTPCIADSSSRIYWPATYYVYTGSNLSSKPDSNASNYTKVIISAGSAEAQNFANWYTYYRSRILAARAGIGRAFALLDGGSANRPALRVGFATINTSGSIVRKLRNFVDTDRSDFFADLYGSTIPAAGTPLRRALDDVGNYYKTDGSAWALNPAGALESNALACRQSFSILMTDGYWTEGSDSTNAAKHATGNIDGDKGYPFADSWSNTLADVAMYYYANDLRTDILDKVPTNGYDDAKHQHMVTFGVGLGVSGTVDKNAAFSAIGKPSGNISWPDPIGSSSAKIDDLLHAAVNSRGDFFSASDPKTFGESLRSILSSISERTASGSNVAANSVALREETRLFQASYVAGRWSGELVSLPVSAANGVSNIPSWRASQGIPSYLTRKNRLFTHPATGTVATTFPSAAQSSSLTADEVAYLQGARDKELQNGGTLRNRESLLGDIVNSSPAYVKESNTLFVGANDGMLHAFDASNGQEVFGYIPKGVASSDLKALTSPNYKHKYFVDGPVSVSMRNQTNNKDILVAAMGRGGKGVFALDVTTPASFSAANVLWDKTDATDAKVPIDADMGNVLAKPLVVRLNGDWNKSSPDPKTVTAELGVIVANGVNSANNKAVLFVYRLDTNGKLLTTKGNSPNPIKLEATYTTPTGANADNSGTEANGLVGIRGWDNDGDGVIDFVYGGDLQGNVWKFDLDDVDSSKWKVAYNNKPLFVARAGDGTAKRQSITGSFTLALDPVTYKPWVFFGTGRYLEAADITNFDKQTWYGIRDEGEITGSRSVALQERKLTALGTLDGKTVRGFEKQSALPSGKKGWFVDLLTPPTGLPQGERMVADPLLLGSTLIAASIIPSSDACDVGGRGFLNAIDAFTGTSVSTPFFDVNGDGNLDNDKVGSGESQVPVGSVDVNVAMPTSPTIVESLLVAGGSLGTTGSVKVNNPVLKTRVSWRELVGD
jgi:type IV pilus assembly protein PilY1